MPSFLHAVTLGTIVLVTAFTLLAAAAGLLWLADTLEHNPKGARTWGRFLVYVIAIIHVCLYILDGYPARQILFSLFSLFVYLRIITLVPTPSLARPNASLMLGILLLPANHISWWSWFIQKHADDRKRNPAYGRAGRAQAAEAGKFDKIDQIVFYAVCVWLVPFFVFLSLSSTAPSANSTNPSTSSNMLSQPLPTPPPPSQPLLSLPPPSTSWLSSFLCHILPTRYFQKPFDPTEGLLTTRPALSTGSSSPFPLPNQSTAISSPQPKWGSNSALGTPGSSMRRVASGTGLNESGMESMLTPDGPGGGRAGGTVSPRNWGGAGDYGEISAGRGGANGGGRAPPSRSLTGGFDVGRVATLGSLAGE